MFGCGLGRAEPRGTVRYSAAMQFRFFVAVLALLASTTLPSACGHESPAEIRPTARPFLWRIERQPASYLYGTIHVPDERVTTLPAAVEEALAESDTIVTEIRLDNAAAVMTKMFLSDRKTLADLLPEDLYDRLHAMMEAKGAPAAMRNMLDRQKIWAALMTVAQLEMFESLSKGKKHLDQMLWDYARAEDKGQDALESIDEQIGVFEAFTTDEQIEMLRGTLDVLDALEKEGRNYMDEIIAVYLRGEPEGLQEVMEAFSGVTKDSELEKRFEKLLLDDRNVRMVERMVTKMKESPDTSFFFAVGAAHFPGEKGILKLLAERGLLVERIGVSEPVTSGKSR